MEEQTLYQMALTRTPGIGAAYTKKLIAHFGDAAAVFQASAAELLAAGLNKKCAAAIPGFRGHAELRTELRRMEENGVRPLFFTDPAYPRRLLNIKDAPPLLFYKGNADLNARQMLAVVGTRNPSEYGQQVISLLIGQLASSGVTIISGLALGIDARAHQAALDHKLPTIGVLGHGFQHLYPPENRQLARAMIREGGLLTSFPWREQPEAFHFPDRNRLVAALCDAVLVIETKQKGGSLLTVKEAIRYQRKVFAVPGRLTDTRSAGCNWLIGKGMADCCSTGKALMATMGWEWPVDGAGIQGTLRFSSPGGGDAQSEEKLLALLQERDSVSLDELAGSCSLAPSTLALRLLQLELRGLISALPGKRYRINMLPNCA